MFGLVGLGLVFFRFGGFGVFFGFLVDSVHLGGLHQLHDVTPQIRKCLVEKATLEHPQHMEK